MKKNVSPEFIPEGLEACRKIARKLSHYPPFNICFYQDLY